MFSLTLMPFTPGDTEQEASWTERQEKRKFPVSAEDRIRDMSNRMNN
jgi:hypothetical protein